jgi:hypothetical protein
MAIDTDRIDDCVLALLLLGRHDGYRVWKSFAWDAMDRLHEQGMISNPAAIPLTADTAGAIFGDRLTARVRQ